MNTCPYCRQAMPWPKCDRDVQIIVELVAHEFDAAVDAIMGPRRDVAAARPRHVAMYLARELLDASYPELGRAFGRDHSTVLNGHRVVRELSRQSVFWRTRLRLIANEYEARSARLAAARA